MVSVGTKIKQLQGLTEKDLTAWEANFVHDIGLATQQGEHTATLTDKRLAVIERIWSKHFAG
ncbi:hypothetical protein [Arenimonas sp.]|uniref:hypothetical protein n=1 Tax=Arenimonas sp. TaxID=1872635 RepID=UPI0025B9D748|nr:hypothetical protein [Arenimonas sp.]